MTGHRTEARGKTDVSSEKNSKATPKPHDRN